MGARVLGREQHRVEEDDEEEDMEDDIVDVNIGKVTKGSNG
jgi:hypothetical protein